MKEYLVEIRLMHDIHSQSDVLGYEEVLAQDEHRAKDMAEDQFMNKLIHSPINRRKMESRGVTRTNWISGEAVEI